jgi:hypothetical protein
LKKENGLFVSENRVLRRVHGNKGREVINKKTGEN